jgi:hypothetical protein
MMRTLLVLAGTLLGCGSLWADDILPSNVVASGLEKSECMVPLEDAVANLSVQNLSRGLKLVEVSCTTGAYNFDSILFAVDLRQPAKARLLRFQIWEERSFKPTYTLTSPTFNVGTLKLTSYHKGRGLGDCGTMGEWRWNGTDFTMTGYWNKENCDGKEFGFGTNVARWRIFPKR